MPAQKVVRNAGDANDPYSYLAVCVFAQVFRDIASYYAQAGTKEDRQEGYRSIKWVKKMSGNFRVLSGVYPASLEIFHQKCIKLINDIKQNERLRVRLLDPSFGENGEGDTEMVQG